MPVARRPPTRGRPVSDPSPLLVRGTSWRRRRHLARRSPATRPIGAVPVAAVEQAAAHGGRTIRRPAPGRKRRRRHGHGRGGARRRDAVRASRARPTRRDGLLDQERIFGSLLGPMPNIRATTNGVVICKGYVVAEFGDTTWRRSRPTRWPRACWPRSPASPCATGKIKNLDEPVGRTIKDGGYDSPHNALVTWKMHLQQETEWEGEMWGKKDDFVGTEAFGEGERKPRELQAARAPSTNTTTSASTASRCRCCAPSRSRCPTCSATRSWTSSARRTPGVDSVPQQLRRRRRQQAGVGERRHALGRRRVDQRPGHGPLRLPVAARRQVGRRSRSCRPTT